MTTAEREERTVRLPVILFLGCVLFGATNVAHCEELPPAHFTLAKIDKPLAGLMVLDGISTEMMLHAGWREMNPLPGMQSHVGRVAWGVGWTLGLSLLEHRLDSHQHRTWARVVRWGSRADELALSLHNFDLARR